MWLFFSTVVVCSAFIYGLHYLLSHLPSIPSIVTLRIVQGEPRPAGEGEKPLPAVPEEVLEFCLKESEDFAQEAMLREAHGLYADMDTTQSEAQRWNAVLAFLEQKYEPPVEAV
jgi:hypothetical protein